MIETVGAHAFLALGALEVYQAGMERLLAGMREPGREEVQDALRTLRSCCAGYPGLSASWLALMIAHFELLAACDAPRTSAEAVAQVRRKHGACIRQLEAMCRAQLLQKRPPRATESAARERRKLRAQHPLPALGSRLG